ncbi:hypothetical protein Pelo_7364 [Pelomyxa schiedti]|nr:hypothetical protein Pelo_7364 [Pelomyxa schiedti]
MSANDVKVHVRKPIEITRAKTCCTSPVDCVNAARPTTERMAKLHAKKHILMQNTRTNDVEEDAPPRPAIRVTIRRNLRPLNNTSQTQTVPVRLHTNEQVQHNTCTTPQQVKKSSSRSVSPPLRDVSPPPVKRCATPNCGAPSRTKRPRTDPLVLQSQLASLRDERESITSQIKALINLPQQARTPSTLRQIQKLNEDDEWLFAESTLLNWMLQGTQSDQNRPTTIQQSQEQPSPPAPSTPSTPPSTPPTINSSPAQNTITHSPTQSSSPTCNSSLATPSTTPSPSSPDTPNSPTNLPPDCDFASPQPNTPNHHNHYPASSPATLFAPPALPHPTASIPSITAQLANSCCGVVMLPPPPPHWALVPFPPSHN